MKESEDCIEKKNGKIWISYYFFHQEPLDIFIKKFIYPLISDLSKTNLIGGYFYIRYWEVGPHIRLRLKINKAKDEWNLNKKISARFKKYSVKNSSKLLTPLIPEIYKNKFKNKLNDSVFLIFYEQEIDRYLGIRGVEISEKQFEVSSKTIMTIIKGTKNFNYSKAIGIAYLLHMSFALSVTMDTNEMKHFFNRVFKGWSSRIFQENAFLNNSIQENRITNIFEQQFLEKKDFLIFFYKQLIAKNFNDFEWLTYWTKEMRKIKKILDNSLRNNELKIAPNFKFNKNINVSKNHQILWKVYASYIHMANNRLGILNRDEAFIGYLIKRTLEAV